MAKKSLKRKYLNFTVLFKPAIEGGYTVTIPDLPGCISEGDSFEEALKNIKEAAGLWLEGLGKEDLATLSEQSAESFVAPVKVKVAAL